MNTKTMASLAIFVFFFFSIGCIGSGEKTPQTSPPQTTPPPPEYEFTAKIIGDILEYELKYISGNKPEKLWITLDYHDDIILTGLLTGLKLQSKTIYLDPEQGTQGDPYKISGGKPAVKTYKIGITPYFQYSGDGAPPTKLKPTKWLYYNTPTR